MLALKMSSSTNQTTAQVKQAAAQASRQGLLLVMTGASGVGKGTLRERWLAKQEIFYSTSWTTRPPRAGEVNGREYIFVSRDEFEKNAAANGFLEYAEFVGNCYGTPIAPIHKALDSGQDVVLEVEVEGAMQIKQSMGQMAILIFIIPPSLTELRRRLTERGTEGIDKIEKRLARAKEEIMAAHNFHYVIVNDDLERAVAELHAIQATERANRNDQISSNPQFALAQQANSQRFSLADLQRVATT